MQAYKSQLRRRLADHGWEVVEVIDSDDWWADEFWKVQSRRNLWGFELVVTFLVNPLWDAPRKKGQGVWAVGVTQGMPTDRLIAEQGIAELCLMKGRFDEKLVAFVAFIDAYRDNQEKVAGEAEPGDTADRPRE
jgi:hypothetical protein